MPNHEGRQRARAQSRPGSPAWEERNRLERIEHAESVAAHYRDRGDEATARAFDGLAGREAEKSCP